MSALVSLQEVEGTLLGQEGPIDAIILCIMGEFYPCVLGLCRIELDGEKREVWEYTIENASAQVQPEEEEREQRVFREVSTGHRAYSRVLSNRGSPDHHGDGTAGALHT